MKHIHIIEMRVPAGTRFLILGHRPSVIVPNWTSAFCYCPKLDIGIPLLYKMNTDIISYINICRS